MASKNISLKEETYELISREKQPGESFSDTMERLVKRRGKLMDAVESWDEVDKDEVDGIEDNIEKARKKFTSEMKESTQ